MILASRIFKGNHPILQFQSISYMITILCYPCNFSLIHLDTPEEGILMTNQYQKPDVFGPEKGDLGICNYTICLPNVKQLMITYTLPLLEINAYLGLKIKRIARPISILHTTNFLSSSRIVTTIPSSILYYPLPVYLCISLTDYSYLTSFSCKTHAEAS